jgi:RimJ/RimL family protein N-acetyltransferase
MLYESRINWAREHPAIERVVVSHRASNHASKFANQNFGFVPTHVTEKVWNDGITETEFHYELIL